MRVCVCVTVNVRKRSSNRTTELKPIFVVVVQFVAVQLAAPGSLRVLIGAFLRKLLVDKRAFELVGNSDE